MADGLINNPDLYFDRSLQLWHYSLDSRWKGIDVDFMGSCSRCADPVYLIEGTGRTPAVKSARYLHALARRAGVPALVVRHTRPEPEHCAACGQRTTFHMRGDVVDGLVIFDGEQSIATPLPNENRVRDALAYARNLHDTAAHGAPQLYDHERQGL